MRTRYSPTRGTITPLPKKPLVSICVVTHFERHPWYVAIPEITRMSLETLKAGAHDYELIIWDNGSPPEFVRMLKEFEPDVLVESYNIGNWNARRNMLYMARGDIVSLADADLLYSPDWLDAQLKILHTYPNIAFVHGCPSRLTERDMGACAWARRNGRVREGALIPEEWQRAFMVSRSMPVDANLDNDAMMVEYNGVRAWVCSLDMQFIAHKEVIAPFYATPSPNLFDKSGLVRRIAEAGRMMLSTEKRTAIHLGNKIDPFITTAKMEMGIDR